MIEILKYKKENLSKVAKFLKNDHRNILRKRQRYCPLPESLSPEDFEKQRKPEMQQKDLPRVRPNKSSKHRINVIAIKGIIHHIRGILSTYVGCRKSSSQRSHSNRQRTTQNHLLREQQIQNADLSGTTPCIHSFFFPYTKLYSLRETNDALGNI